MKKFEPHYRLVRIGVATKIEKASRQQRTLISMIGMLVELVERAKEWITNLGDYVQVSNAKIGPRRYGVQPSRRLHRRIRRNKETRFGSVDVFKLVVKTLCTYICSECDGISWPTGERSWRTTLMLADPFMFKLKI